MPKYANPPNKAYITYCLDTQSLHHFITFINQQYTLSVIVILTSCIYTHDSMICYSMGSNNLLQLLTWRLNNYYYIFQEIPACICPWYNQSIPECSQYKNYHCMFRTIFPVLRMQLLSEQSITVYISPQYYHSENAFVSQNNKSHKDILRIIDLRK